MSLNYDLRKIKNFEETCLIREGDKAQVSSFTEALIFVSMIIDVGDWSEKNMPEVLERIRLYEEIRGPLLTNGQYLSEMEGACPHRTEYQCSQDHPDPVHEEAEGPCIRCVPLSRERAARQRKEVTA